MDDREQRIWKSIGQTIRTIRRSQNLSVDKLASQVGVVRQQIVRLEAGLGGTTVPRLLAIADALGVTLEDLIRPIASQGASSDRPVEMAFRGKGLSAEEMEKVLDYIAFLEHQRGQK
jgi:transcriptional regulator with XRE-family HTH domain